MRMQVQLDSTLPSVGGVFPCETCERAGLKWQMSWVRPLVSTIEWVCVQHGWQTVTNSYHMNAIGARPQTSSSS